MNLYINNIFAMMFRQKFSILFFILIFKLSCHAQITYTTCPSIIRFEAGSSLPNSCPGKYNFVIVCKDKETNGVSYTLTYDFGDGSPIVNQTILSNAGTNIYGYVVSSISHVYITPGSYTAKVTFNSLPGSNCNSIIATKVINVPQCSSCQTYSVLSSGYDRLNQAPLINYGNFDPNWKVIKKQYVNSTAPYAPTGTETLLNISAYDVAPYIYAYFVPLVSGDAKLISISSSGTSIENVNKYIVTYRTYFDLPIPLPTNVSYSLALNLRADDAIYKVRLNDINIKPVGYSTTGNIYTGEPLILSVKSCDSTYFKPGSNYIDITVGDLGYAFTVLSADILLYQCPSACNCPIVQGANYQITTCDPSVPGNCKVKCKNINGVLQINSNTPNYSVSMNFGDGSVTQNYTGTNNGVVFSHNYDEGTYTVTANISGPGSCLSTYTFVANVLCQPPPCTDCISSFAPIPDSTYIISAWVKEANATVNTTNYTNANIKISFYSAVTSSPSSSPVGTPVTVSPSGLIIDGWQKIEQKFKIPAGAAALKIDLISNGQDANFDDIRVFPYNGSVKSYVYDPNTMRLMAELDERNYATFYEYDEEGKLTRVKKETEKGIMTIKESRNSSFIKP